MAKLIIRLNGEIYHLFKAQFKELLKILNFKFVGNWKEGRFEWTRGLEGKTEKIGGIFQRSINNDRTEKAELWLDMDFETYVKLYDFWVDCIGQKFPVYIWREMDDGIAQKQSEEIPELLKTLIGLKVMEYERARKAEPKLPDGFVNGLKEDAKQKLREAMENEREFKAVNLQALEKYIISRYDISVSR